MAQVAQKDSILLLSIKASLSYFLLVFGAGFVLGPIRILVVVPRVGTRTAELLESPIMLLVILLSAGFVVQRFGVVTNLARLSIGCVALALVLTAEFSVVLWIRGMSVAQNLSTRDPLSGTVYYALLLAFAAAPMCVRIKQLR